MFDEDEEEANLCPVGDKASKESELHQEDKVNFNDPESLKQTYHELLSNLFILWKAYKNWWKDFKKLSKDHKELEKVFQDKVDISLDEST